MGRRIRAGVAAPRGGAPRAVGAAEGPSRDRAPGVQRRPQEARDQQQQALQPAHAVVRRRRVPEVGHGPAEQQPEQPGEGEK